MGFIKEVYANNRVNLIVAFKNLADSTNYVNTNDIDEAIKYFNLTLKDNMLYAIPDSEIAIQKLDIKPEEANTFREKVNSLLVNLDDETAIDNAILYPIWTENQEYITNERVRYNNTLYKVLKDHTSQASWAPNVATSLFANMLTDENGAILEWVQPDSTNPYMTGDKVIYNDVVWISTADNNSWAPGTTGAPWEKVVENIEETIQNWEINKSYSIGEKVMFNDKTYESIIDNNVWSPADYPAGWTELEQ